MEEAELPDLESFRCEVSNCPNGIRPILDDSDALYRYVGLPSNTGCFIRRSVEKSLFDSIAGAFQSGHRQVSEHFRLLRREMLYEHILEGTPLGVDFATVAILLDATRPKQGQLNTAPRGDWKLAVQRAVEYETLSSSAHWTEAEHVDRIHRRELEVARAALRLRNRGYTVRRERGRIFLEATEEDRLVSRLQQLVASFPGSRISRQLFTFIFSSYDHHQERYHYGRRPSLIGEGHPQVPINYLLQLCAKYPFAKKPYLGNKDSWRELIELSTDYAALFDVQTYSQFELLFQDIWTVLPFLQGLALYDSLFSITQIRPSDVMKLCRGLLGWLDPEEKRGEGWTLNDLFALGEMILSSCAGVCGPSFLSHASASRDCPTIDANIVSFALDNVFSHPLPGANQRFNKPTDTPEDALPRESRSGHDFFERPLLKSSDNRFFLIEKPFCAPAIIEAIFTALRSTKIKNFESLVGFEMERFLLNELESHGIPVIQGDYDDSLGLHAECDAVIECPDTIIFLEMKKQPLTRKAQAGYDAALLVDMAASLLLAQLQAGWHEVRIRRDGFLLLEKDGKKKRVDLNGRAIERIAVTLFDYGSFQDRTLLQQFLQAQLSAEYSATDPSFNSKLSKINDRINELRSQTAELQGLLGEKEDAARFFNCWFLSIPQFLILLDDVDSPEALKSALWNTRHSSMGTLDFYFEHARMRQIRDATAGSK